MANRTVVTGGVWAEGAADVPAEPIAETTYALSTVTEAEIQEGWPFSKIVDSAKHNELMKRLTSLMLMVEEYGVLPWCATTSYKAGAVAMGSNGSVYKAVSDNTAQDPTSSPSVWRVFGSTPSGIVEWFAGSAAPAGYLKCNGAAVSRTTYADLFAAIGTTYGVGDGSTTFNVPDVRGEFIRGFDDGRGVDAGRTIGSTQTDDFKSHTHPFTDSTVSETSKTSTVVFSGGTPYGFGPLRVNISSTTNAAGGTETRPRNIAFLACIKY